MQYSKIFLWVQVFLCENMDSKKFYTASAWVPLYMKIGFLANVHIYYTNNAAIWLQVHNNKGES